MKLKTFKKIMPLAALSLLYAAPVSAASDAPVVIPAPPAGKGQIVFYRTGTIMGAAMGCAVNEGGQKISSLGAGRYFVLVTEPGRHEYTVKSEAKDMLALEVESGETQYAMCKIKMGIMAGRPDLRPSTEAEFRKAGTDRLVDADDMGPAPGAIRPDQMAAAIAAGSAPAPAPAPAPEAAPAAPAPEAAAAPATN
ncbi:hypothetical protein IP81_02310 [Novosphingobium sp. AAP83]|uniref:DUF2846 domain-containing protein n=1 Tax=Novosphingobium sp. AAP83 TaxID=1523425 RepID=UPI0006B8C0A9|nr:DUF2846 domain-containing protein [Novosphingobium sp. AAP83]KPF93581.1 hypothetical protein IP81_02310 [Novosphingobium sp. AAP83]